MSRWTRTLDLFGENLGLKLVSVVISVGLFAFVRGSGTVQRSVDLPLVAMLPEAGDGRPVLLSTLPEKVRLSVRGTSSVVSGLRADEIGPVQIDLRAGRRGLVRLSSEMVRLPAGSEFLSITPAELTLQWDVTVTHVLPIRAAVVGSLPPRARVDGVEVEPARLRVRGPALYVDPMVSVHTESIDTTGLAPGRYERRIALEPPRAGVEYESAAGVRVTFEIVPTVGERRFPAVPVVVLGGGRLRLRPPVVDVVVQGDPDAVEALTAAQVVPVVEAVTAPERGPHPLAVQVRPLPHALTARAEPAEVLSVGP